jgi:hypothetical protein
MRGADLPDYIRDAEKLGILARHALLPPLAEIRGAWRILARNPVAGYAAFTEKEVRLIAAYRVALGGLADAFWQEIAIGGYMAWAFAIHEARELQAFAEEDLNPYAEAPRKANLLRIHRAAMVFELQYIQAWARQLGFELPELALERRNPVRRYFSGQVQDIEAIQSETRWPDPTLNELDRAEQFWTLVRQGGQP